MAFLLDTSIFITLKNELPMDIYPSLWSTIERLANGGVIFSCMKVKDEIFRGNDDLKEWCRNKLPASFFIPENGEIMGHYANTISWAINNPVFNQNACDEYARVADAYLVATAAAMGFTIVTNETSDPQCRRRVKIPDACNAAGVAYSSINDMFRSLGVVI